jgi:hypothetical protein
MERERERPVGSFESYSTWTGIEIT